MIQGVNRDTKLDDDLVKVYVGDSVRDCGRIHYSTLQPYKWAVTYKEEDTIIKIERFGKPGDHEINIEAYLIDFPEIEPVTANLTVIIMANTTCEVWRITPAP